MRKRVEKSVEKRKKRANVQKPSQHVWSLVERIIGFSPGPSPHVPPAIAALAAAANLPDWTNLYDVDVPIYQHSLSVAIDEAIFLSTAPDTRSRALAHSSSLPHAGDWLNVVPSAPLGFTSMTRSSDALSGTGWGSLFMGATIYVLNVGSRQM